MIIEKINLNHQVLETDIYCTTNTRYVNRTFNLSRKWRTGQLAIRATITKQKNINTDKRIIIKVPTDRKDIDSCIKFFLDTFQGYWYKNDKQIEELIIKKWKKKYFRIECHEFK